MQMLDRKNATLKDVVHTLQITHDNVDEDDTTMDTDNADRPPSHREILRGLMGFLQGC